MGLERQSKKKKINTSINLNTCLFFQLLGPDRQQKCHNSCLKHISGHFLSLIKYLNVPMSPMDQTVPTGDTCFFKDYLEHLAFNDERKIDQQNKML